MNGSCGDCACETSCSSIAPLDLRLKAEMVAQSIEPEPTCPHDICGEAHAVDHDCRTCWDCDNSLDGFVPTKATRDGHDRCEECHEARLKLQRRYRAAIEASEYSNDAERFCAAFEREVL